MSNIYKIYNNINEKLYIGQTINTIDYRFKKHLSEINSTTSCSALYSAFKKYGKENFQIELIISGDFTPEVLNELEIFYIKEYNSLSPNGYNLQSGGKLNMIVSEETRKKISESNKGRDNTSFSHKISASVKKLWENEEYREHMSKVHTGKRNMKYIKHEKPLRLELDINNINLLYNNGKSIYYISKLYGVSYSTIKKRIKKLNEL